MKATQTDQSELLHNTGKNCYRQKDKEIYSLLWRVLFFLYLEFYVIYYKLVLMNSITFTFLFN